MKQKLLLATLLLVGGSTNAMWYGEDVRNSRVMRSISLPAGYNRTTTQEPVVTQVNEEVKILCSHDNQGNEVYQIRYFNIFKRNPALLAIPRPITPASIPVN